MLSFTRLALWYAGGSGQGWRCSLLSWMDLPAGGALTHTLSPQLGGPPSWLCSPTHPQPVGPLLLGPPALSRTRLARSASPLPVECRKKLPELSRLSGPLQCSHTPSRAASALTHPAGPVPALSAGRTSHTASPLPIVCRKKLPGYSQMWPARAEPVLRPLAVLSHTQQGRQCSLTSLHHVGRSRLHCCLGRSSSSPLQCSHTLIQPHMAASPNASTTGTSPSGLRHATLSAAARDRLLLTSRVGPRLRLSHARCLCGGRWIVLLAWPQSLSRPAGTTTPAAVSLIAPVGRPWGPASQPATSLPKRKKGQPASRAHRTVRPGSASLD